MALKSGGYVYFIQEGDSGPIKIGRSTEPWKRLVALQTSNSATLHMRLLVDGGENEREIHERFSACRIGGEWFSPSDELVQFIVTEDLRSKYISIEPDRTCGRTPRRASVAMSVAPVPEPAPIPEVEPSDPLVRALMDPNGRLARIFGLCETEDEAILEAKLLRLRRARREERRGRTSMSKTKNSA